MEEVYNFIINNTDLNENDSIVIGLSGGPDSMALLDLLLRLRNKINIKIVCAHVNHNIRKESEDEKDFVKDYCNRNNLIFEYTKFEYDSKFTESLGHKMRYEFFRTIIKKYNAKYLFTAHHGDDLIETALMRIVRGSTLKGYAGYESIIKESYYTILRPLVLVTKDEIMNYVESNTIPYVIDNSNNDVSYTRNRYRKYILPKLKEEDINVHKKFKQYSDTILKYSNYIDKLCLEKYNLIVCDNKIDVLKLKEEDDIIVENLIQIYLHNYYGNDINLINSKHMHSILDMIYNDKPNLSLDLPLYRLIKNYSELYLTKDIETQEYNILIEDEVKLPNNRCIRVLSETNKTSNYVTHLNSDTIKLPLYVRNYKNGDSMTIKNMSGHKKIKDIFINEKVDLDKRSSYPVVVDSEGNIVWLPGLKKSSFDSQDTLKYDIILEYY